MIDATDKSGESVLIRKMDKNKLSPQEIKFLHLELKSNHPNIITWTIYDVGPNIYLVRPKLKRFSNSRLPEKVACYIAYQLLTAVAHSPNYLKPDKIYANKECTKFYFRSDILYAIPEVLRTCGSADHRLLLVPPEVLRGHSYSTPEVAIWHIGNCAFFFG